MSRFRLALSSAFRRPLHTLVAIAGVGIAIAAAFSLLAFQRGYRQSLWRDLDRLGAHILVVPKGCPYEAASLALHGANWPCYLKESYLDEVRPISGIAAAAPVLMVAFYGSEGRNTVYCGIDTNLLALKPAWRIHGAFPKPNEILIGAEVAIQKNWKVGMTVDLPGPPEARVSIAGVLESTQSSDDSFIFLPLNEAQRIFRHSNELTHILVRLSDPNRLDTIVTALRGCNAGMQMNIVPLTHLFRTIQSLANSTRWFLACATLASLLAAGAGISATLLISVTERTREIGVMRALGASRMDIISVIWLEAVQICFIGASGGILAAFASMRILENWLRLRLPFAPAGELLVWQWPIAAICAGAALVVGSLAAGLPAWRAAELTPMEAMRHKGVHS
jgi:putative ABC transport system permease protein